MPLHTAIAHFTHTPPSPLPKLLFLRTENRKGCDMLTYVTPICKDPTTLKEDKSQEENVAEINCSNLFFLWQFHF